MNLTETQVEQLFDFVRSKYVRYYDLQLELVDHLASAIEQEMIKDQSLSYDQGLQKVYNRWPVTGFNLFIEEKRKGLRKYWRRRFWIYIRQYFELPKIILTLFLTTLFYYTTNMSMTIFGAELNLLYILIFFISIKAYYDAHNPMMPYPTYEKEGLLTYEIFFEQIAFILAPVALSFYSLIQAPEGLSNAITSNTYLGIGFSLLLAFSTIVLYAKGTTFKQWIAEEIQEKYPEYLSISQLRKN